MGNVFLWFGLIHSLESLFEFVYCVTLTVMQFGSRLVVFLVLGQVGAVTEPLSGGGEGGLGGVGRVVVHIHSHSAHSQGHAVREQEGCC